ncbi:glycosyltransferase [Psychrobacter sp.]|uniref:glycosyltransferase n=1 Tax=Psychrobacter sp. TaxID=56811 RepID=UPI0025D3E828|nr:glycosyltransferase [Psychrobacter sp.]
MVNKNNKKNNIIVLSINSLQGAGAERFVLTMGRAFDVLGYDVHILCFDPTIEFTIDNELTYHLIDYKSYRWLPKGKVRYRLLAHKVDAYILKHIGIPKLILSNLERSYRVFSHSQLPNIVYVIHNTLSLLYKLNAKHVKPKLKEELKEIYSKHPCVCVSHGVKEDFINNFGNITPTSAIHNPIDREHINLLADEYDVEYKNYIIHVGSFKEAKRHDILLKAYAKTSKNLPLLLLGKGKLRGEIEKLVSELNLEDKVIFLGFKDNPYPYIKNATLKVLTSEWEGFALVIPEALALGVPVISTDCPSGPNELLPKNNLMPSNDIEAIATKLDKAMQNPKQFLADFDDNLLPKVVALKYLELSAK